MYGGVAISSGGGGEISCIYLATVLSCIDLIPFFYMWGRPPPHLNRSPPPMSFDADNPQAQRLQTWSQLFATCSYQQNHSEPRHIVCYKVFDPLPVCFFSIAFVLAVILLLFNLITMTRNLRKTERIFRTVVHTLYAVELFATAFVYFINRHWCYDCKELVVICIIPILTTLFMPCNWHECHVQQEQLRTIVRERQQLHSLPSSPQRLTSSPMIIIDRERPLSSLPPRRPSESNSDPHLENEYNNWLEANQTNITQQQQI